MTKNHRYTKEQIDFISDISKGRSVEEIREMFNKRFDADVTFKGIKGVMHRHQIKNHMQGYNSRFQKGHIPWSKGKKGINVGGEKGWFKEGNLPPSHRPVGSESIIEGYVWIKIEEPNVWKKKHHHIWEQKHGSLPDGMVLRFADGDKMNVTLDNLFMTPQRAMTSVVRRKKETNYPEINVITHKLAELELAIKDKQKEKQI